MINSEEEITIIEIAGAYAAATRRVRRKEELLSSLRSELNELERENEKLRYKLSDADRQNEMILEARSELAEKLEALQEKYNRSYNALHNLASDMMNNNVSKKYRKKLREIVIDMFEHYQDIEDEELPF